MAIALDPNYREDSPDHPRPSSTLITQLINCNDSETCDVLTNSIFVFLLLLLLGCLGLVIAMCIDSKVIGVVVDKSYKGGNLGSPRGHTLTSPGDHTLTSPRPVIPSPHLDF